MSSLFNRRLNLTVIRDVDVACTQLEQALADADPALVPGLQHALDLLRNLPSSEEDLTTEWARGVLAAAGVDPKHEVRATKALREAKPELSLGTAVEIAKKVAR
ncbi:hypothetical protein ACIPSA_45200 [Streptomyces sp. NPDC086549]|uniref:hypothetical protein n=1 Tax=Streptomyces sp. NPDC086549 TaxID=3365752 RepID=UPI00382B3257